MNRQEAIQTLVRAGKGQKVREVIEDANRRADRAYREIRNDRDYSDDAKRRRLAGLYARADANLTDELTRLAGTEASSDRDDAERVFGVKGIPGDPATLIVSRRDAADRVAGVTKSDELRALLVSATRSGDEVLARAIVEKAVQNQDAKTAEQFRADRPHLYDALERLWNAERHGSEGTDGWEFALLLIGLRPDELGRMSADSAETFARS